jgi:hypothetical protein
MVNSFVRNGSGRRRCDPTLRWMHSSLCPIIFTALSFCVKVHRLDVGARCNVPLRRAEKPNRVVVKDLALLRRAYIAAGENLSSCVVPPFAVRQVG